MIKNIWLKSTFLTGCAVLGMILLYTPVYAQSLGYYRGSDCVFNTSADISAGCSSANYLYIQYQNLPQGLNLAAGWTLRVRANADFTNGSSTIPAESVSLAFNGADGSPAVTGSGTRTLSKTTAVTLLTGTAALETPPYYYFVHRLNMAIAGGNHLLAGSGTYTTNLTLTLVAQNGTIISTNNSVQVSFVVNFNNSCSGATINSYAGNQYSFADYQSQMNGVTTTDAVSIQYNPNNAACTGWSLKVRAASNFINGSVSVPVQYFALRFNRVAAGVPTAVQIGVTNNPVPLSFNEVSLINNSQGGFTPYSGTEHKFDMIITGGNHLLVPNGTYRANLVFTLYNQNNEVVSIRNQEVSFQVNSSINSYTVVLQNDANVVNLVFNTLAHFTNGVSVTKSRGLRVTGNSPYQIFVKTSATNLQAGDNTTIPVSAVNIQATRFTTIQGTINTHTRALSAVDQVLISNPMANYTQQNVEYDLRYYTSPGDNRLSGKSGLYNTTVFFVAVPQ